MKRMPLHAVSKGFLSDERASISIEFMIIMPLLVFLTTGGVAFWDAFYSNSRTAKVAYVISDIMSRHDVVDATDMAYLFNLQEKMLPGDLEQRALRISSICFEDDRHRVLWSYTASGDDATPPTPLVDDEIPVAVLPTMAPQDSVILTEVAARWQPHFVNVGRTSMTWRSELVSRPRFVKIIPHTTLNPSNICPEDE
jgi:hypothetical protein